MAETNLRFDPGSRSRAAAAGSGNPLRMAAGAGSARGDILEDLDLEGWAR